MSDGENEGQPEIAAEKPSRLQALLKKAEQLQARIELEKQRQKIRSRKDDNRRKILYGVAVLAAEQADLIDKTMLRDLLDQFITAERDRIFLGLEQPGPVEEPAKPEPAKPETQDPEPAKPAYGRGSFDVHPDTEDL